jgi:hypothetical protein
MKRHNEMLHQYTGNSITEVLLSMILNVSWTGPWGVYSLVTKMVFPY